MADINRLAAVAGIGPLDGMEYIRQRGEAGRQRGRTNYLSRLAGQAFTAAPAERQAIIGQAAQHYPQQAMEMEQAFAKRDDSRIASVAQKARYIVGLAKNGQSQVAASLYPQLAQEARSLGLGEVPDQWDDSFVPGLEALAAYGVKPGDDTTPADIRSLQMLQANPELAALDRERRQAAGMVPKLVETSQGYGWGTPGAGIQLAPLAGVAGQGQPQQTAPAPALFAALGQKYGIQPTSVTRTPERNREVRGVDNSYHLSGQAADWVVPQQYKAQFMQDARANGFEAIDEGNHIHIEPAGSRGGPAQGGGNIAQPWEKPDKVTVPSGYRLSADGGYEYVPGGPADPNIVKPMTAQQRQKIEQTMRKERQMLGTMEANIDNTVRMVDDLLQNEGSFGGITGMGAMGARIPGSRWADLAAKLDTLKARSAFGSLQEMRANSPTGGALGSVSERELYLLQNAETQLQDSQSPESLAESLREYKRTLLESKRRMREGTDEFYRDVESGAPAETAVGDDDALIGKYL